MAHRLLLARFGFWAPYVPLLLPCHGSVTRGRKDMRVSGGTQPDMC